jgi:hypothetical protein
LGSISTNAKDETNTAEQTEFLQRASDLLTSTFEVVGAGQQRFSCDSEICCRDNGTPFKANGHFLILGLHQTAALGANRTTGQRAVRLVLNQKRIPNQKRRPKRTRRRRLRLSGSPNQGSTARGRDSERSLTINRYLLTRGSRRRPELRRFRVHHNKALTHSKGHV